MCMSVWIIIPRVLEEFPSPSFGKGEMDWNFMEQVYILRISEQCGKNFDFQACACHLKIDHHHHHHHHHQYVEMKLVLFFCSHSDSQNFETITMWWASKSAASLLEALKMTKICGHKVWPFLSRNSANLANNNHRTLEDSVFHPSTQHLGLERG